LILAIMAFSVGHASAHSLTDEELKGVGFTQRLGEHAPLNTEFLDESGQHVTLSDYFGERPVILTLNYLRCPNLCPIILPSLAADLNTIPFKLGQQFTVLTVSIDPRDTPEQAESTRATALESYEHPDSADGWHVLTGHQEQIDQLADAVGFQYRYDEEQDEYAHPAGIVLLTPDGTISRYLYGLDFSPNDLRLGLVEAAQNRIGSLVDQVLLTCFQYDAQVGRYTPIAMNAVRLAGVLTVLALGGLIGYLALHKPRSTQQETAEG